jgi:hypothetical protein
MHSVYRVGLLITVAREIGWGGMNWIRLTHNRDQWRALVNTVMNFQVSREYWEFME